MDLKLSVVMSAFNSSKWIEESIKSVLAQSFKNFEFIIVNDGSTDSTSEILEKYQSIDNRIIVITKNIQVVPSVFLLIFQMHLVGMPLLAVQ